MTEQPNPGGAVFVSYASQDAKAAGRICEAQEPGLIEIKADPLLDPLRKIDRFQDLLAGLHFPA